ncbi:hypothetical protein [Streptomyces tsukubensis]|uniref:Resolvase/invertase-type recombinase catalytic domain-containing protein n=1 Tax=Streptomyces tsukubensis TaxID=83656 RepID=A0A1V4ADC4_9ACTN|nr:hypothetical protein [Streptomyces tsukubensis]OON81760.1 hypothetical protein B1H18_06460 [Streptomyces tsukubensis]QFR96542.1 hypothetical protein GBW32_30325 [Streptomyces tsukubensis]
MADSTHTTAGAPRAALIAGLTPLERLDADPFLVDTRTQYAVCHRWAARRGYRVTSELLVNGARPDHRGLWADVEEGNADLFVVAGRRALECAVSSAEGFIAECERRGVRVETAQFQEPAYDAATKARIHRRLSMPTAGYDGC